MGHVGFAGLAIVTALGATAVDAQRIGAPYEQPGAPVVASSQGPAPARPPVATNAPPPPQRYDDRRGSAQGYPGPSYRGPSDRPPYQDAGRPPHPSRWARTQDGRWAGGSYAPGGWTAYRHPTRGARLPRYWDAPEFYLGDYAGYGLSAPPPGYRWHRYYDEAVLLDPRGRVWDTVDDIDWERDADWEGDYAGGYGGGYGDRYAPPPHAPIVQNGSVTTYTTSSGYAGSYGGGYAVGGYYPGATTVVTVQSAPVVSTSTVTTEYVERTRYVGARQRVVHVARPKPRYRPVQRTCGCVAPRVITPRVKAPRVIGS